MQTEMAQAAGQVFRQLNDADLKFGTIRNDAGRADRAEPRHLQHAVALARAERPQGGLPSILSPVRRPPAHAGRGAGRLGAARHLLRPGAQLPERPGGRAVPRPRAGVGLRQPDRRRSIATCPPCTTTTTCGGGRCGCSDIHHYDTYVPILADLQTRHTWNEAVETVLAALAPLGSDYCGALERGPVGPLVRPLREPRQAERGLQRGSYDGDPYILMNYQPDVLDHVFTLAHEAGHSMHSYYSAKHQPFAYYDYAIFVAEVASTFNEQLLGRHLLDHARDDQQRAFLINRQIDAMRGTIIRQTMFAEFEKITHATAESGEPLTVDRLQRDLPRAAEALLRARLRARRRTGPGMPADSALLSGVLRLQVRHRHVGRHRPGRPRPRRRPPRARRLPELPRGGCSKDPLDLLRDAGVDMEQPTAIDYGTGTIRDAGRRTRPAAVTPYRWVARPERACHLIRQTAAERRNSNSRGWTAAKTPGRQRKPTKAA